MRKFAPNNVSQVAYMPAQYGWPLQEPLVMTALAGEMHDEAGTSVDGRYQKHLGETHATSVVKRQDTYLTGTAGRTGFAFTQVQGAWKDDYEQPTYHTYCLGIPDGSPSTLTTTVFEVVSASAPDSTMEHAEMWLQWGDPPVSTDGTDYSHDRAKRYTYVHLAYQSPDKQDYRIAFEYGQPIRLDVSYDGGANWLLGVAVLKDCGNFERFLEANGKQVRLRITPSLGNQTLGVEVNDGHMLTHTPDKDKISPPKHITSYADSDPLLPRNGKIRILHRNSTLKFAYWPSRFQDLKITKSAVNVGDRVKDASGAFVVANSLGSTNANQQTNGQVTFQNGKLSWNATATLPDSGDGLGSKQPAALNDVSIVVPAKWGDAPAGTPPDIGRQVARLDSYWVEEIQRWNDNTRCLTTEATLIVENYDGRWDGLFGQLAINIQASNGYGGLYQRLQGVVDGKRNGITFDRRDPVREMILRANDKSVMMLRALDERRIFDGWCIWSIVRYLCEKGGIHPAFLTTLPIYVPPGATKDAPYGPSGYDCPYYSLPRGTGLKPFFEFPPDAIIWQILQSICQFMQASYDKQGNRATWYMGFTADGQFHFEPVELYNLPLAMSYSTVDRTGWGLIQDKLQVINDISDLRTSIDFIGIDARTFELIFEHRELPWQVQIINGCREPWLERGAAFCSAQYTSDSADEAARQCSRPRQRVLFTAPFHGFVQAGALISVTDDSIEGGTGYYSVETLISRYGLNKATSQQVCQSVILARSLASTY